MKSTSANFPALGIGSLFIALSIVLFFSTNAITIGGPIGVSVLMKHLFNIKLWWTYLAINCAFLLLGYRHYGGSFLLKTLFCIASVSVLTPMIEAMLPIQPGENYGVLGAIFSGLIFGFGSGIILSRNASPGSWTILAKVLSCMVGTSLGTMIFVLDSAVILLLAMATSELNPVLYGLISIFITGRTIDFMLSKYTILSKGATK